MNVYVKKGEKTVSIVPYIVFMIIFTIIIFVATLFLSSMISSSFDTVFTDYASFIDFITLHGFTILCFTGFGFIFLFLYISIIVLFFKSPKEFKATLTSKKIDTYNGKEITYMTFNLDNSKKVATNTPLKYTCFTYEKNDFIEGNDYLVKIKEFNWNIREVNILDKDIENKFAGFSLLVPFLLILYIFGGGTIMVLLRINFCVKNNLPFLDNMPALCIFSAFVFADCGLFFKSKHKD